MPESTELKYQPSERRSIAQVKLFSDLDSEERAALERECTLRRFRVGERVFER